LLERIAAAQNRGMTAGAKARAGPAHAGIA
jgi:hypothetical protein